MILLSSIWLGLLTSITPCVLSANFAIISYIYKKFNKTSYIVTSTIFYIMGRIFVYIALSFILSNTLDSINSISSFLQNKLNIILGIIFIFVSFVLLNLIEINFLNFSFVEKIRNKTFNSKYLSSFIFGILFAGMFCPITTSLFFTNLLQNLNSVLSSILYGFGTGITSIILALLLIVSKDKFNKFHDNIDIFRNYSSKITGFIFLAIGIALVFKLF